MTGLLGTPRIPLATTPTPLEPAPQLSDELGVEVWLKRDDLTGLGMGGNKTRQLEYLLADARAEGADCLVTGGGPQSNWVALSALAARRCGMDAYPVLYGRERPTEGNLRLQALAGAEPVHTGDPDRSSVDPVIRSRAEQLREDGRSPYVLPRGGATDIGSVGYVDASLELASQLRGRPVIPHEVWLATGSCGTQAGLVAGARWLALPWRARGVTTSRPVDECVSEVRRLAAGVARCLDIGDSVPSEPTDVEVIGGHLGPGYGQRSAAGDRAARLVARTEGVILDPVFGAKAMAGLVDAAVCGDVEGPVVFLVTGGYPTVFVDEDGRDAAGGGS